MIIDESIRFATTDWDSVPDERHEGITGYAIWKVKKFGDIRVRKVFYSENYLADHWCDKGHFIFCVKGEMVTELKDGSKHILREGMSYQVGDNADAHKSHTEKGATLFILD
jgi:hypothetical protein